MRKYLVSTVLFAFFACSVFAAQDVASGVVVTVKAMDRGAKTAVVKTEDGTEYTVRFVRRTVVHGAQATAHASKDAFLGVKEGDEVIVHYTVKGGEKTAEEIDHIGKDGLKMSVVAVKSVDHAGKTITVRTAEGAEETYHFTDRAAQESGKGLEKAGQVTVYYTEDAGKKVIHFLKS